MRFPTLTNVIALALAGLTACGDITADDDDDEAISDVESSINGRVDPVRVHAILTANDDGSQAAYATAAQIQAGIRDARPILAAAGIELTFDPESDVSRMNSTPLNYDCSPTPKPGSNLSDKTVDPNDCTAFAAERDRVAVRFPGKLVVYLSSGDAFQWNDSLGMWVHGPRGYNWSNHVNQFVALLPGAPNGEVMAHEMGHYFHLTHTMYPEPATMAAAADLIRAHVAANNYNYSVGMSVFDNDGIDTPPDPGMALFAAGGLDPCNPAHSQLLIPVNFPGLNVSVTYTAAPDRENIMSYWNRTCRGLPPHMTNGQIARVRDALENGNRHHLIAQKLMYSAVWEEGDRGQTRAIGWAFLDFANRMKQELAAGNTPRPHAGVRYRPCVRRERQQHSLGRCVGARLDEPELGAGLGVE